jgi:hypothetical protein
MERISEPRHSLMRKLEHALWQRKRHAGTARIPGTQASAQSPSPSGALHLLVAKIKLCQKQTIEELAHAELDIHKRPA